MILRHLILLGSVALTACNVSKASDLEDVHHSIEERYNDVAHIPAQEFTNLEPGQIIVFDTRAPDEYAVSHLPGAIRIDPDIEGVEFLSKFHAQIQNREVVFYCSVGERSSRVAQRVDQAARAKNLPLKTYNLEQGIFGWHNAQRQLVQNGSVTDLIHPYDENWGQLVTRQDKVSYD